MVEKEGHESSGSALRERDNEGEAGQDKEVRCEPARVSLILLLVVLGLLVCYGILLAVPSYGNTNF